jgi:hypothetical protein
MVAKEMARQPANMRRMKSFAMASAPERFLQKRGSPFDGSVEPSNQCSPNHGSVEPHFKRRTISVLRTNHRNVAQRLRCDMMSA